MLCTRLKHKPKVKVSHGTPKQGRLMRRSRAQCTNMSSPFKRLRLSPVAERLQERENEAFVDDGWNERQRVWRTNATKRRMRRESREDKENFVVGSQVSSGKESGFHDVPSGSDTVRHSAFRARGQLKVAVGINNELLTVHVVQARLLHSDRQTLCNSYIQVFLSPDVTGKTCCCSEVVYDTNNPQFNEKFTYELMGEDSRKRLTILIWNKDCRNNCTELLGCMSFGMRHLLSKPPGTLVVDGWYHLLGERLGLTKHLQIPCGSSRQQGHLDVDGQIMEVNASLQGMDAHTLVITRGTAGYGFTVTGSCPVKVGSIRVWGAAHEAGLQEGDFFVRINGLNVSRSSVESVARNCQTFGEPNNCGHTEKST
ncbi:Regulator of G-protein signaling 3 [Lamellibrachia satsuma]|nr:Regulator of G-protein signaling 3 [Lamellibrachia satsuma]